MYYKLTKDQVTRALAKVYISDPGVVSFDGIRDLYKDVLLITGSCGRGKTTFALSLTDNGLLNRINEKRKHDSLTVCKDIKACEVLFLTSRTITKKQQEKVCRDIIQALYTDYQIGAIEFDCDKMEDKIRIATAHQFGMWIKRGLIEIPPKIIILDELHSLISETIFAEDLIYTIDFVKEHYNEMIKIGLTATPDFLFNYIEKQDDIFSFRTIDKELGSKYKVQEISAYVKGSAQTLLKQLKINSQNKCIYYTQSAKECYKLAQDYGEKAGFIISDYNESKTANGKYLTEIMNEQGIKDYVITNESLPRDIDILFINSSCREGMNIKDINVQTVICESVDMITIEQILGRIRNNIKEFYIVANYRNKEKNTKNIKEILDLTTELCGKTDAEKRDILIYRCGQQKENKDLQKLAYCYKGDYRINSYAIAYLKYIQESYIQLSNSAQYCVKSIADRQLLTCQDYIKQLAKYTDSDIKITEVWTAAIDKNHDNAIARFKEIEPEWLDKPLTTADKKRLSAIIDAVRNQGKPATWNTVKQILIDNGYTITDKRKRIDGKSKQVSIIQKPKNN